MASSADACELLFFGEDSFYHAIYIVFTIIHVFHPLWGGLEPIHSGYGDPTECIRERAQESDKHYLPYPLPPQTVECNQILLAHPVGCASVTSNSWLLAMDYVMFWWIHKMLLFTLFKVA